jgi:hypothetical protein
MNFLYRHSAVLHDSAMWVFGGMTDLQDRADFWKFDFSKSVFTLQKRRSDLCIPRNETARLPPSIHVSVSELNIPTICPPILQQNRWTNRENTVYKSITDTWMYSRNRERGRAVSLLGIFVSNFRHSVFAVHIGILYFHFSLVLGF